MHKEGCPANSKATCLFSFTPFVNLMCFLSDVCVCAGDGGGESHVQRVAGSKTGAPAKRKPQQTTGWGADQCHEGAGDYHAQNTHTLYVPVNAETKPKLNVTVTQNVSRLESVVYSHGQNDQNTQHQSVFTCSQILCPVESVVILLLFLIRDSKRQYPSLI